MNLPMASVLRRLRRERNITQETLAEALGVTFQSVSRWENGLAYPDVELIPKIAGYFGVSVDVLFGTDQGALEAKRQAYLQEIEKYDVTYVWDGDTEEARRDGDKFIAANYAMLEEFPDDCDAMFRLLQFYMISRADELPAHTEELKRYCRKILELSRDERMRTEGIDCMVMLSDDAEAEEYAAMLPHFSNCRGASVERRYDRRGEAEKCDRQKQLNFRDGILFLLSSCIAAGDAKQYVMRIRLALSLLDLLRDPTENVDAWLPFRAFLTLRLSSACFGAGEKEEGYCALESAIDLFVTLGELSPKTNLSYHSLLLDMLTVNKESDIDMGAPGYRILYSAYIPLTRPAGWEWFNCVRGEERYKELVRRLEPYLPEGNAVNL